MDFQLWLVLNAATPLPDRLLEFNLVLFSLIWIFVFVIMCEKIHYILGIILSGQTFGNACAYFRLLDVSEKLDVALVN
jgi:hypothetical protein